MFSLDLMKIVILILTGIFQLHPIIEFISLTNMQEAFFIEGFGMLHRYKDLYYDIETDGTYNNIEKNITEFSLGVSVGGKWVTKSGFVAEIFGGIGRNILNNSDDSYDPIEVAGRVGISIGKRF
jgi:hypothetical protein